MSQPVKLPDELVLDARVIAEVSGRSIPSQIEFWAALGRAIEPLLDLLAPRLCAGPARCARFPRV